MSPEKRIWSCVSVVFPPPQFLFFPHLSSLHTPCTTWRSRSRRRAIALYPAQHLRFQFHCGWMDILYGHCLCPVGTWIHVTRSTFFPHPWRRVARHWASVRFVVRHWRLGQSFWNMKSMVSTVSMLVVQSATSRCIPNRSVHSFLPNMLSPLTTAE